jgi:hypothetical protein
MSARGGNMRGKTILFFDTDRSTCRVAERALNATGSRVLVMDDPQEFQAVFNDVQADLVMASYDESRNGAELLGWIDEIFSANPATRFVLHTTEPTEEYLRVMQERRHIRNLIAKSQDPLEPDELIITAEKLLRGDLFGLKKYLRWGVEPLSITVKESDRKRDYVGQVVDYATSLGCGSRTVELTESIVDELVTNAIFNAPRNPDGSARYRGLHRSESVVLDESEEATLNFACDGDFIAISSSDPFGALDQDTVVAYLHRCFSKGPRQISKESGGAGVGLYHMFSSVSKFVVNLDPGKRTEVVALIDLRLSMKQFRQAGKSFHFFVTS